MKHRFQVLDIFRGMFASFVFLFHLSPFAETAILNNEFVRNSDMFVDFFFVLSGFVIAYSYQHIETTKQTGDFFKKRLRRIYPLHFVMLMAFVVIEIAKHLLAGHIQVNNLQSENNGYTFITSLFLLNSFPVFSIKDVSWNIPSWSISAEMAAYLVFGLLVFAINKFNFYKLRNVAYLFMLSIMLFLFVRITGGFELNFTYDYGFLRGIIGFLIGVLCLNFFLRTKDIVNKASPAFFSFTEPAVLILVCWSIWNGAAVKHIGLVYEPIFFSCIYIFSFEKGIVSSTLKKINVLEKVGKYSYSIYMTHALLISLFNVLFIRILKFPPTAYSYLFILNYLLIYFVSAWTYKNIELRFHKQKHGVVKE
ncbi:acyltransferase family protein [Chitinophagaceae bacterium LWZ2-11]